MNDNHPLQTLLWVGMKQHPQRGKSLVWEPTFTHQHQHQHELIISLHTYIYKEGMSGNHEVRDGANLSIEGTCDLHCPMWGDA